MTQQQILLLQAKLEEMQRQSKAEQERAAFLTCELHAARKQIQSLNRQVKRLEEQVEDWQSIAKIGIPELMQKWLESEYLRGRRDQKNEEQNDNIQSGTTNSGIFSKLYLRFLG